MEQINREKRSGMIHRVKTPGGRISTIYNDMAQQNHLLIAGTTGSGKSVVLNGIIHSILVQKSYLQACIILIDPKGVELAHWKETANCIYYAQTDPEIDEVLKETIKLMDNRYKKMQAAGEKTCSKADIYLLIDELASISSNQKTSILAKLQKISQNGRPVKIHVIVTTQCPTTNVIPTAIKVNFDAILGLRTRSAQDSRNIIGENGCEKLPQHGKGYYIKPDGRFVIDIHEPSDEDINAIIEYWSNPVNYIKS